MRNFILLGCCLLLSVPVLRAHEGKTHIDDDALAKLNWKLGCQAYTFRSLTLFETIDTLNQLGLRYIEIYPGQRFSPDHPEVKLNHKLSDERIEQLKQKLHSANVTSLSFGVVNLPNNESEARKVFDFAMKLGLTQIVSEPPADAFELIDKLSAEYGINVAIHNHPAPSAYADCQAVYDVLQKRSQRIGACADTGHWYRSELSATECLKKLQGRIHSLHLKDVNTDKRDVPLGTGEVEMKAVLAELKRQGDPLFIAIEYESGKGDQLVKDVARCIKFVSDTAGELAE